MQYLFAHLKLLIIMYIVPRIFEIKGVGGLRPFRKWAKLQHDNKFAWIQSIKEFGFELQRVQLFSLYFRYTSLTLILSQMFLFSVFKRSILCP